MTRFVVAAQFAWDEYPALRVGRLFRGEPDVGRHPVGETHLVEGSDAVETLCGLPRASFPYEFPQLTRLNPSEPCTTCRVRDGGR